MIGIWKKSWRNSQELYHRWSCKQEARRWKQSGIILTKPSIFFRSFSSSFCRSNVLWWSLVGNPRSSWGIFGKRVIVDYIDSFTSVTQMTGVFFKMKIQIQMSIFQRWTLECRDDTVMLLKSTSFRSMWNTSTLDNKQWGAKFHAVAYLLNTTHKSLWFV